MAQRVVGCRSLEFYVTMTAFLLENCFLFMNTCICAQEVNCLDLLVGEHDQCKTEAFLSCCLNRYNSYKVSSYDAIVENSINLDNYKYIIMHGYYI